MCRNDGRRFFVRAEDVVDELLELSFLGSRPRLVELRSHYSALHDVNAIRTFVTGSLAIPGFRVHWVSDKVSFSPDGRLAYMRSVNEMTLPGPAGTPVTLTGRAITVWRKEADGQWRCVVDIWNDPPATTIATTP